MKNKKTVEKELVLNAAQIRELKWFCNNVNGVRTDFYGVMDVVKSFDNRIRRLEVICELMEKYAKENEKTK